MLLLIEWRQAFISYQDCSTFPYSSPRPAWVVPPNILVLTRGDDAGNTLLLLVAAQPDIDVSFFQLLLQHQALVIAKNNEGQTPLHLAARPGPLPRVSPCAACTLNATHHSRATLSPR